MQRPLPSSIIPWFEGLGTMILFGLAFNIKITDIIRIYSKRHVTSFQPMIALDSCLRWDKLNYNIHVLTNTRSEQNDQLHC